MIRILCEPRPSEDGPVMLGQNDIRKIVWHIMSIPEPENKGMTATRLIHMYQIPVNMTHILAHMPYAQQQVWELEHECDHNEYSQPYMECINN